MMKRWTAILLTLCCAALLTPARGQDYTTTNSKAIKLYERGQKALYQSNAGEAVRCFEQALEADPAFVECHLVLAEWYQDSRQPALAKEHYYAAVAVNANFFPAAWLELGELELAEGHLDKAIANYDAFLQRDKSHRDKQLKAEKGKETALFRRDALAHPVAFNPQNMGAAVNSAHDEYLPALTVDGQMLVFTRRLPRRATTTANTPEEEDFYVCRLSNGRWGAATRMAEPVNSNDNEGAQCISQDGRIMFFTACERQDGGGRCDLYMCVNKGGKWSKPRNLGPAVNTGAWESQPSFSIDGKTLYFVSDRKGGYGGMDIWKTVYEGGTWSAPVNLGPTVNTSGNEMTPFIHYDDQTLYFSSDGHAGMGGMDLFCSRRQGDGGWSQPENLGYPINTSGDESGLIVSADARTAIFATDRAGGYGKMDLYSFELPVAVAPQLTVCWKGLVTNAKNGAKVAADIQIIDVSTGKVVANTSSDATSGEYLVSLPAGHSYAVHASAKGYLFYSAHEELGDARQGADLQWESRQVDISLNPIEAGERMTLNNVFFETGKYALLPSSEAELERVAELLQRNATLRVELGGHTDNVGRPEDNQRLSEQRAKAVYDYLIAKGIAANRLSYKGYGETQPVATNATEEGRAENRRTEMKIL